MRVLFAGTPDFAVPALHALMAAGHTLSGVLTQPDRPAGRGQSLRASPVKQAALAAGLPVLQPASLRDPTVLDALVALRPEVLVVVAYGLILPEPFLHLAPFGAINIHASLLPRWRGAAPIQRAILAGDRQTGVTIMQMEAGLDTGPAILAESILIGPDMNAGELHDRLSALGARLIVSVLADAAVPPFPAVAQPEVGVCHAAKIRKSEALIDWRQDAASVLRTICAFAPVPAATATLEGTMFKLHRAHRVDEAPGSAPRAPPGTVLAVGQAIEVACGDGVLAVTHLQRAGGRAQSAVELLRGYPIRPGQCFDALAAAIVPAVT